MITLADPITNRCPYPGPIMTKQMNREPSSYEILFSVVDNIRQELDNRKIYYKLNRTERYILELVTKTIEELK